MTDNNQQFQRTFTFGVSTFDKPIPEAEPPLHKSPFQWMDTDSPAWRAIVDYVLAHQDDINNDINDFGDLKPVLDHFNRNC